MVFNSVFEEKKTETEMVLLNQDKEEQGIIDDRSKNYTKMNSVNKSLKVFGLLVIYIIFWTFIFYSVEECIDSSNYYHHLQKMKSIQQNQEETKILKENQQKINEQKLKINQQNENQAQMKINKENQEKINKTNKQIDNDIGLQSIEMLLKLIENANSYKKTMKQINSSSEITNKRDKRDKQDKPDKTLCTFEVIELMKWSYYTVVNLLTISTEFKTIYSAYSQIIKIPFILIGSIIVGQLYSRLGFITVNLLNARINKFTGRLKGVSNHKHKVLFVSVFLLVVYIITCGFLTNLFKEKWSVDFNCFYQWTMILLSISDESLLTNAFQEVYIFIPILLILFGYVLSGMCLAAFVNFKYSIIVQKDSTKESELPHQHLLGWFA